MKKCLCPLALLLSVSAPANIAAMSGGAAAAEKKDKERAVVTIGMLQHRDRLQKQLREAELQVSEAWKRIKEFDDVSGVKELDERYVPRKDFNKLVEKVKLLEMKAELEEKRYELTNERLNFLGKKRKEILDDDSDSANPFAVDRAGRGFTSRFEEHREKIDDDYDDSDSPNPFAVDQAGRRYKSRSSSPNPFA